MIQEGNQTNAEKSPGYLEKVETSPGFDNIAMIPVHVAKLQTIPGGGTAMTHSLSWLRRYCSLPDSGPWPRGLQK
jgi:archaellum component FlaD/FlaE